jgi:DNA-binding response OmpR family regulator
MHAKHPACDKRMLQGMRILVVEDEALISMLLEDGLNDAGAEVIGPAASVEEALGLIEGAHLDGGLSAAVLDINLIGQTVIPVADRLAALGVPFLFTTGYTGEGRRGLHEAAPTLVKPFDGHTLPDIIKDLTVGSCTLRRAVARDTPRPDKH